MKRDINRVLLESLKSRFIYYRHDLKYHQRIAKSRTTKKCLHHSPLREVLQLALLRTRTVCIVAHHTQSTLFL